MSRANLALWLLENQSGDDDYPAAMEKIGRKLLDQADVLEQKDKRITELEDVILQWLRIRDWCITAGGKDGPLPQDVIEKFAEMQLPVVDAMKNLLSAKDTTGPSK